MNLIDPIFHGCDFLCVLVYRECCGVVVFSALLCDIETGNRIIHFKGTTAQTEIKETKKFTAVYIYTICRSHTGDKRHQDYILVVSTCSATRANTQ